jgi:hypothetical protein
MARQYAAVAQHGWQLASSGRYGSTQATLRPAAGATWMRRPPAAVTACCGRPARTTVAGGRCRDAASGSCHSTARAASSQRGEAAGVGATRHLAAVTTPCGRPQRGAGGRRELRASFVHPNPLLSAQDLSLQSTLGDSLYNSAAVSTAASEHET